VVHRDIKPANILLHEGVAMVADFGIARAVHAAGGTQLTLAGGTLGTPRYMSPEQAYSSEDIDARTDIYSLGCVLYEMLVGAPPAMFFDAATVVSGRLTDTPVEHRRQLDNVPAPVESALAKAMAKHAEDRFGTAAEFGRALVLPSGEYPVPESPEKSRRTFRRLLAALVVLAAVAVTSAGWWLVAGGGSTATETPNGPIPIAVLVFENRGAGESAEYLGDGIAEDVNTQLAKISGFAVKAHASARQLTNDELTYREIANRLGADLLMHGSFRHAGDSVRITAQLIDPETESVRWADDYTRVYTASNMFAITRDVAERVASDLQLVLSAQEQERLAVVATEHTEAYRLYLQGRFFWDQRGEGIVRGLEYFERAVALDSLYAPAYAGIADAYSLIGEFGMRRPSEVMPLAEAAAVRALELDSSLAEAHVALGYLREIYDWDMPAAESHFRRAIELNPSYVQGHYRLAEYLYYVAFRDDEALAAARRAVELDPLSLLSSRVLATVLAGVGQHAEAITEFRRAIDLEPAFFMNYHDLALIHKAQERYPEALALLDTALAFGERHPLSLVPYASVLLATGDTARAVDLYDELVARQNEEYIPSGALGCISVILGRIDEATEWGVKAVDEREPNLISGRRICESLGPSEVFEDPRWDDFWRRRGMP
jgi:serine/threonine-protein kinase